MKQCHVVSNDKNKTETETETLGHQDLEQETKSSVRVTNTLVVTLQQLNDSYYKFLYQSFAIVVRHTPTVINS